MKHCIVFFNGWTMQSLPNLQTTFECIHIDFSESLCAEKMSALAKKIKHFPNIYFVGFSLGVYAAHQFLYANPIFQQFPFIAINGTAKPLHDAEGIPLRTFQATLKQVSLATLQRFHKAIGYVSSASAYLPFWEHLNNFYHHYQPCENIVTFAVISKHDAIFALENQQRHYQHTPHIVIDAPHYPFALWQDWQELLNLYHAAIRQKRHQIEL